MTEQMYSESDLRSLMRQAFLDGWIFGDRDYTEAECDQQIDIRLRFFHAKAAKSMGLSGHLTVTPKETNR